MFEFVRFLDKRTQLIALYINVALIVSTFPGKFMFKEERKRKILEIIEPGARWLFRIYRMSLTCLK
jgi:hypothetical protein